MELKSNLRSLSNSELVNLNYKMAIRLEAGKPFFSSFWGWLFRVDCTQYIIDSLVREIKRRKLDGRMK